MNRSRSKYIVGQLVILITLCVFQSIPLATITFAEGPGIGVVNTARDPLNIRSGPGTSYPLIGQIAKGEILSIRDTIGEWHYVQLSNGMVGYAFRQYVRAITGANLITTTEAFVNALGSEREIYLSPGDYILDDALKLENFKNLKIIGIQGAMPVRILVRSRTVNVVNIRASQGILFDHVVLGHTEGTGVVDNCEGGVLDIDRASDITVTDSTLYGSGVFGVRLFDVNGFTLSNSMIKECTEQIMDISASENLAFENSSFFNNQGYIDIYNFSSKITYANCNIESNKGRDALISIDSSSNITFTDCDLKGNQSGSALIRIDSSSTVIAYTNCDIENNTIGKGPANDGNERSTLLDVSSQANADVMLQYCRISDNSADELLRTTGAEPPLFMHCELEENEFSQENFRPDEQD
jgi:hypothetical protein